MCSRCPKQRRVIAGSLRVTYDLLWYSFLYAEIWQIHYDISASIFDNCTTMCEFSSSSDEMSWKPHKWERHHCQASFSTHNYPGWISSAIHTRNNNLVHFFWIYINLVNNFCFKIEKCFCVTRACTPTRDTSTPLTYELVWNLRYVVKSQMNVVLMLHLCRNIL